MSKANIFPALRYSDADAALEFFRDVFGLTEREAHRNDDGQIMHAEMQLADGGMIMFGTGEPGAGSLTIYAVVPDPRAHYETAKAAGAEIVEEPTERDYGSLEYQVKDIGGVQWCFGTYDPYASSD